LNKKKEKSAFSVSLKAFDEKGIERFLNALSHGRQASTPIDEMPTILVIFIIWLTLLSIFYCVLFFIGNPSLGWRGCSSNPGGGILFR